MTWTALFIAEKISLAQGAMDRPCPFPGSRPVNQAVFYFASVCAYVSSFPAWLFRFFVLFFYGWSIKRLVEKAGCFAPVKRLARKIISEMTCNVLSGMLYLSLLISLSFSPVSGVRYLTTHSPALQHDQTHWLQQLCCLLSSVYFMF